ncbi:hypothetical protein GCM10022225_18660 [Plantactinospora mayteni]|uniref:DUF4760 domain-containing protein n=1 Tax=Plantactinospora mayteni TaxID=566021 RepID=A0ABQ4EN06_9ACTN|nr:DUF6082 family protein [Plantactinospora mayteni]GIG96051.1 hypothetical protein Pma05_26240 [Plantactinospora mayteni]
MAVRETHASAELGRRLGRPVLLAVSTVLLGGTLLVATVSPAILNRFYSGQDDYSQASDVGQAYGAASALLAALALLVVCASLAVQYNQFRYERVQAVYHRTDDLVQLAVENPEYCQCWGARVSPDHVDERLFYYCSLVIKSWTRAWERRGLTEPEARNFLAQFFDSEVPRLFWQRHGDWHLHRKPRTRAARFMALVNEEYLCAVKAGPPSRSYEPPTFPVNPPWDGLHKAARLGDKVVRPQRRRESRARE